MKVEKLRPRGTLPSDCHSILLISVALLMRSSPAAVAALLLVQIVYKVNTPIEARTLSHPVVATNLFVAAFHVAMLFLIWQSIVRPAAS